MPHFEHFPRPGESDPYMPPHIICNISSEITAKAKADANSIRVDDANRGDGRHLDGAGAVS